MLSLEGLAGYGMSYGLAFTQQELDDAAAWLKDQGYLRGQGTWNGGIPRPGISPAGEQIVESGRSVNDVQSASASASAADVPTVSINVQDPSGVNTAANSPGSTQSATLTKDQRQQVVTVADALDAMRGQVLGPDL